MKKILNKKVLIIILTISLLIIGYIFLINYNIKLKSNYNTAVINNKAFISQLDKSQKEKIVFQTTIEQLHLFNDSITEKLLETQKQLKIKDKEIKQLAYISSAIEKTDTIIFRDTIFKDKSIKIDTTIGDKWVTNNLHLQYPNTISIDTKVNSEKNVLIYAKKETVNPPKKFFLFRLFQKKHTIIKAIVNEENPYIINENNTFYQIIK